MSDADFFPADGALSPAEVAALAGAAEFNPDIAPDIRLTGVSTLEDAGPTDVAYMDHGRYADALAATRAGLCLVGQRYAHGVPTGTVALVVRDPYGAYAAVLRRLYPSALRPLSVFGTAGVAPGAVVHPTARLEAGVTVDPGAVVGPGVEIGRGTVVAACAVIGPGVRVGRDCSIGPGASVLHAFLGNRVVLHPGVRVGQDGFGYAMGRRHSKVPQIGRVIIQDDVEIGANTTIDRGATRDTIIGEGTKIDNLVQIAHNVVIGRHCLVASLAGISGSTTLEDYVVLAGKVGTVGHIRIGTGAQIAGDSNVYGDVPPGSRWGGTPAKPTKQWFRELATLKRLALRERVRPDDGQGE